MLEKKKIGELVIEGSNPEHSGRVRGVAGFYTPTNYFRLAKQRRVSITKVELLARDKERDQELQEARKFIAEHKRRTQELIREALDEFQSRMGTKVTTPPVTTPISDKGSHHNVFEMSDSEEDLEQPQTDPMIMDPPPVDQVYFISERYIK